jgi:aspartate/methionine/tyrosine aminotransferase
MAGVKITHYPLDEKAGWRINFKNLETAVNARTRAIVLISPHNPTGMVARAEELDQLADLARRHELPLIVDEVFASFTFQGGSYPRMADRRAPLILTLNGFSKMLALPGVKLGWIALTGDSSHVAKALRGLDGISDTFLPVADPVQGAAASLLEKSKSFQRAYQQEIEGRAAAAAQAITRIPSVTNQPPAGGFYTTLKLREGWDEEMLALRLLEEQHLLLHPGYFYDLEGGHLIISHVGDPAMMQTALEKIARFTAAQRP